MASESLQLKSVVATAAPNSVLTVTRAGSTMTGVKLTFDPATQWMTATGTPRSPAVFHDPSRSGSVYAEQLEWNTETWQIRSKNVSSSAMHR